MVSLGRFSLCSCRKEQVGSLLGKRAFLLAKMVFFFIQKSELPRFTLYKPNLNCEILKYLKTTRENVVLAHPQSAAGPVSSSPRSQTALASKAHRQVPNALTGAIPLRTTSPHNLTPVTHALPRRERRRLNWIYLCDCGHSWL